MAKIAKEMPSEKSIANALVPASFAVSVRRGAFILYLLEVNSVRSRWEPLSMIGEIEVSIRARILLSFTSTIESMSVGWQ